MIVSNVDSVSFAATQENLGVEFDAIVTAEAVGAYKPDPKPFLRAIDTFAEMSVDKSQILHVAQSLFHDHEPAKKLGLRTAWVDRRHDRAGFGATPAPVRQVKPDIVVKSLEELVRVIT